MNTLRSVADYVLTVSSSVVTGTLTLAETTFKVLNVGVLADTPITLLKVVTQRSSGFLDLINSSQWSTKTPSPTSISGTLMNSQPSTDFQKCDQCGEDITHPHAGIFRVNKEHPNGYLHYLCCKCRNDFIRSTRLFPPQEPCSAEYYELSATEKQQIKNVLEPPAPKKDNTGNILFGVDFAKPLPKPIRKPAPKPARLVELHYMVPMPYGELADVHYRIRTYKSSAPEDQGMIIITVKGIAGYGRDTIEYNGQYAVSEARFIANRLDVLRELLDTYANQIGQQRQEAAIQRILDQRKRTGKDTNRDPLTGEWIEF